MKNKLLTIVIFSLAFTACFNGQQGDEGTLIINLGGGRNGRSAADIQWPPSSLDGDNIYFSYPTKFIVTLSSPTGKREESFYFQKGTPYTDTKISLTVTSGLWNIRLETIIYDSFLYAAGSRSVDIKAGQANSVPIEMKRKYYKIGEEGPGGGIIFHVAPEGFIMTDNKQICHYLEAAPSDVSVEDIQMGDEVSFYVDGTGDGIGNGRNNTEIIVNALKKLNKNGMATQHAQTYINRNFNDWFLPSLEELKLMYENLYNNIQPLGNFRSGQYWSSSFVVVSNQPNVKCQMFADGHLILSEPNSLVNYVRAIRAF